MESGHITVCYIRILAESMAIQGTMGFGVLIDEKIHTRTWLYMNTLHFFIKTNIG